MVVRRKKRSSSQQEMPAFTMTTTLVDEEGNEIRTVADAVRVKRETSEKETADVSTTEKVIQVTNDSCDIVVHNLLIVLRENRHLRQAYLFNIFFGG